MLFSVSPSQALLRELAERMEPQQLLQAHNDGIQSIEAQVGCRCGRGWHCARAA